jgi:hypothetical protein
MRVSDERTGEGREILSEEIPVGTVFQGSWPMATHPGNMTYYLKVYDGIVDLVDPSCTYFGKEINVKDYVPLEAEVKIKGYAW